MKKLFAILLTVLISLPVFSQLKFGIKGGVSTTSVTMDEFKDIVTGGTTYSVDNLKSANYGIHLGFFARLSISKLYIQPELLFSTRSNSYTLGKVNQTSFIDSLTVKQSFNKLDIPVMVGLKFGPVRINAGPVGSLNIGSPKALINDPNLKDNFSKLTYGYQAGVGLDILKKLTIDLRYEGNLKKYQNQIQNAVGTSYNLDDRSNAFLLSVGYIF
ncbi:MAG: porin family protein [Bacteroidales bacterium]|jgi:opacity protein-like surface antigen